MEIVFTSIFFCKFFTDYVRENEKVGGKQAKLNERESGREL